MATPSRGEPVSPDVRVPAWVWWGLVCAAAAYVGYLGLLVTCDLLRVAPHGIVPAFGAGGVTVQSVQPGTPAAVAGIQPNDRILRVNGQVLQGPVDWQWARVNTDPSRPLEIDVGRDGQVLRMSVPLASGIGEWRTGASRPGLIAFRLVQIVTLGFALMVAFRRASQLAALLGAWLLASFATVSLTLPVRMFHLWQMVPQPLEAMLWVPYATSAATGPLLFTFFAVFPRRTLSRRGLLVALAPGALATVWFAFVGTRLFRPAGPPTGLPDLTMLIFAVGIVYGLAGGMLLVVHHREAEGTDRRRIRVLIGGLVLAVLGGGTLLVLYGTSGGVDIFGSPLLTVLALIFLGGPASFAYAILRHRLFGLRLIVRQGVRYALARGFLSALIPVVAILLLGELALHRNEPLSQVVQYGWWWYTLAVAILLVIRHYRERWLRALDRRFFRERYDANRLLENVVTQIKRASSTEAVAQSMVQQIDEALHPEFVEVLMLGAGEARFVPVTGSLPTMAPLPASLAVIGLLTELQRPLTLTPDTASLRHQLSAAERARLSDLGIELIVPVFAEGRSAPVALMVLGPRRSEEPYNRDDLALLGTIAHALGMLMRPSAPGLSVCSSCGRCYDRGTTQCTLDGTALANVSGSRQLNRRYRLERRLDRGGMGMVYEAFDEVLERKVAVKVIREELLVGPFPPDGINPRERFLREARTAAALTHINVVRTYDFGVDLDDRAFLVMELLEGETLRQRLQRDPVLAPGETLHILQGVCSGLMAAHRLALVHRDLKPENIFLQRSDGRVIPKVLDFGLAKAFSTAQNAAESGGTGTGVLVGTLDYMAPEQILGDKVNPAWDVWAVSVMAFEMLTGRHPFRSTSSPAAVDPESALLAGNLPRPVASFFKGALSPEGSARPKDAMGFLSACEQVLA